MNVAVIRFNLGVIQLHEDYMVWADPSSYSQICSDEWYIQMQGVASDSKLSLPIRSLAYAWRDASTLAAAPSLILGDSNSLIDVWNDTASHSIRRNALVSLQRASFIHFFTAYETFQHESMIHASGKSREDLIQTYPGFEAAYAGCFGVEMLEKYWLDPTIQFFRNVRDTVVMHAGDATVFLSEVEHDIHIVDGELEISHGDNCFLITFLWPLLLEFIELVNAEQNNHIE